MNRKVQSAMARITQGTTFQPDAQEKKKECIEQLKPATEYRINPELLEKIRAARQMQPV